MKRASEVSVEIVEDIGHHLMRVAPRAARQIGHELGPQGFLDAVQYVLLDAFHPQHPHHDLHRETIGQHRQHPRGVVGP